MPNKRDPNKSQICFYVEKDVKVMLKAALDSNGLTITDFLYLKILELLNKGSDEVIQKFKEHDARRIEGKAKRDNKKHKKQNEDR